MYVYSLSNISCPAQRIQNTGGPTPLPLSPLEQLKHDLNPTVEWQPQSTKVKSGGLLHLPERIASLERCTDIYSGEGTLTPGHLSFPFTVSPAYCHTCGAHKILLI